MNEQRIISCSGCIGIIEVKEKLSAADDELMELVNHQQKEAIRDVKLRIRLTKLQLNEFMNILSNRGKVFTHITGKSTVVEHKIELANGRSGLYPLFYWVKITIYITYCNLNKDGANRICVDYAILVQTDNC